MISVAEAKTIILQNTFSLQAETVLLADACGLALAADVIAEYDIPNYAQSSMDGYAFRFSSLGESLKISSEIAAGSGKISTIAEHEAARIFTGAPLPAGADTVVMQEKCSVSEDQLTISDSSLIPGSNVRSRGAEIQAGELAMHAGSVLTVGAMGFLAGIGIKNVVVYPRPFVTVIVTGNELQEPGAPLSFGGVYNANSLTIVAALKQAGVLNITSIKVEDDLEKLVSVIAFALDHSDIVLLSGGVSVGDYDFVVNAATRCGVKTAFHRIKQKPGKPLYFGTKGTKLIFGLPGNPSSSLTCFYMYVLPCIEKLLQVESSIREYQAALDKDIKKIRGLTQFVKASLKKGIVSILTAQESFRLYSFAQANSIAELSEDRDGYSAGETIKVHLLPGCYEH